MQLKYYTVVLDGIDKSGKDTIARYIWEFSHTYHTITRDWPSMVAYGKKFKRPYEYALPPKDRLYVYCTVGKNDWLIRCKITNEDIHMIKYDDDTKLFDDAFDILASSGYHVLELNTTKLTPYTAAKLILKELYKLNEDN